MRAATLALIVAASLIALKTARAKDPAYATARGAFSPLPQPVAGDAGKISLGRALFYDRRMSRSMTLSCASCHDLASNGASATRFDRGDTAHIMPFNTPTVFNSVYSFRLGWEGRHRSLHDLALGVLRSEHLMSGGGVAIRRIAVDAAMVSRFRKIYGTPPREDSLADALSAFLATLVTPDAPFDRWLRGDRAALTPQQVEGYKRFVTLGCASCHQGVNIGANIFQRRGIFHALGDRQPKYLRVPSLRNVAVTAPYFHDGSISTLPEAVRKMAHSQLALEIGDRDIKDISAFLGALTGRYQGHSLRAPGGGVK